MHQSSVTAACIFIPQFPFGQVYFYLKIVYSSHISYTFAITATEPAIMLKELAVLATLLALFADARLTSYEVCRRKRHLREPTIVSLATAAEIYRQSGRYQ